MSGEVPRRTAISLIAGTILFSPIIGDFGNILMDRYFPDITNPFRYISPDEEDRLEYERDKTAYYNKYLKGRVPN